MAQITLDEINRMDRAALLSRSATFSSMRHGSPRMPRTRGHFPASNALFDAMTAAVRDATPIARWRSSRRHPDLAGKAAREGAITDDSKREQSSAGLDRLSEHDFAAFHRLNDAYKREIRLFRSSSVCAGTAKN